MAITGLPQAYAKVLAVSTPTKSEVTSPGPTVTAIASTPLTRGARGVIPAFSNASLATGKIFKTCALAATSGTTPPYFLCISICDATTLDSTSTLSPLPRTTAAAVSSQLVSMPSIIIIIFVIVRNAPTCHSGLRAGIQGQTARTFYFIINL